MYDVSSQPVTVALGGRVGVFSRGIHKIPFIKELIGANELLFRPGSNKAFQLDCIVGWGNKSSAVKARNYAESHSLPYISLEDGWIRSLGLKGRWARRLSIVLDDKGIYYDARKESRLELLIKGANLNPKELARAQALRQRLMSLRISKFNHYQDIPELSGGEKVLVVDQTYGDLSIACGLASDDSFETMLEEARRQHPSATIYLKVHPEVVAGIKRGHFDLKSLPDNVIPLIGKMNPIGLLEQMSHVHVVTSQLGFEALMLGKKVTCHGAPFYAGWGLTDDRIQVERRGLTKSVDELFHAAYLQYARFINPINNRVCELDDVLGYLTEQLTNFRRNAGSLYCVGFRFWKHYILKGFLESPDNRVTFCRNLKSAVSYGVKPGDKLVVWANNNSEEIESYCADNAINLVRVEDGFIRSSGLGSDFVTPLSLVFDGKGIYYNPNKPSGLEYLLSNENFSEAILDRARKLRKEIVRTGVNKYNLKGFPPLDINLTGKQRKIFVPGQVENDASVVYGGGGIQCNKSLLEQIRNENPDAYILYKPHPDVVAGNRHADSTIDVIKRLSDKYISNVSIIDCLDWADEVHTLTSLTGFEALLRGIPVTTYGVPFYAGWGLTRDRAVVKGRQVRRSLDELVAAALILYPSYFDWDSKSFITVEQVMSKLSLMYQNKRFPPFFSLPLLKHGVVKIRQLFNMLKYS